MEVVDADFEVVKEVSLLKSITWPEWCIITYYMVHRMYVIFN